MKTGCGPRDVSVMLTKLAEFLVWQTKHLHVQKHSYGKGYGIFLVSPVSSV